MLNLIAKNKHLYIVLIIKISNLKLKKSQKDCHESITAIN